MKAGIEAMGKGQSISKASLITVYLRLLLGIVIQPAWTKDKVPCSKYGTSDKGWITTELTESWFNDLFLPNAVAAHPLLLLLDGHCNHYQLDLIKLAIQNMC